MNGAGFPQGEVDTVRLRTVIAAIDHELALLPTLEGDGVPATQSLRSSWAELVELLAVGPAPETRPCPICGYLAMRAATRCGNCWNTLQPCS